MKELMGLILALVMCLTLVGCGGDGASKETNSIVESEEESMVDFVDEGFNQKEVEIDGLRFFDIEFENRGEYEGEKEFIVLTGNIENTLNVEQTFEFAYSLYYDNGDEYIESDRSNYNYRLLPGEIVNFEEVTSSSVESKRPVVFYKMDKIYPYNEDFPIKLQDGTILGVNKPKLKNHVEALIDAEYKTGVYDCDILSSTENLSAIISIQVESNDFENIENCKDFARDVIVSMSSDEQYLNVCGFQFQFVSNGILTYSIDVNEIQSIDDISLIDNYFEIY